MKHGVDAVLFMEIRLSLSEPHSYMCADRLYNDILVCIKGMGVGFTIAQVDTVGPK